MDDNLQKAEIHWLGTLLGAVYVNDFRELLIKHVMGAFHSSHNTTNLEFGFGGTKADQNAIDYLRERVILLSDKTAARLEGDLKFTLLEGLKNTESIADITKRLSHIFKDTFPWELERIARTETLNALAAGRQSAYEKSNVVQYKMIIGANDKRLCALCRRMRGQIKPVSEPFRDPKNPGESWMHPPFHPNGRCLYENPLIYTVDGWKPINKINIGDLVLTHKGRFRPVTEIYKQAKKEPRYKITIYYGGYPDTKFQNNLMTLTVTPDHPFMTDRGWVEAQNLNSNDKIQSFADICKNCDKLYPKTPKGVGNNQQYKFCSISCGQSYTTLDQWENTDMREVVAPKISTTMKEQYASGKRSKERSPEHMKAFTDAGIAALALPENKAKNWVLKPKEETIEIRNKIKESKIGDKNPMKRPEVVKKVSDKLKLLYENDPLLGELHSIYSKFFFKDHPEKHPNYIMAQKGFESTLEKIMREELESRNIEFNKQEHVDKFWIDFAIPDLKIGIECDGEFWHKDKERDLRRDKIIESYGWQMLHFTGQQITKDVESCVDSIERLMKNHNNEYNFMWLPIKNILITDPPKIARMTWNLSVEEDESFIAKSFVVHNCSTVPLRKLPDNVITTSGQMYAADKKLGKVEIPIDLLKSQYKVIIQNY